MEISIEQIKQTLLDLGFIQNEYLDLYTELMFKNLHTIKQTGKTQAHHIFPVNVLVSEEQLLESAIHSSRIRLSKLKQLRKTNSNALINLSYKDHQLAHAYLTLCTDLDKAQQEYESQAAKHFNPAKDHTCIHKGTEFRYATAEELPILLADGWELGKTDSKRC